MKAELFTTSALLPDIIKHDESYDNTDKRNMRIVLRPDKTADLSQGHHLFCFSRKMPPKKGAQKFHTGDVSPPRSGKCFLLVEANSLTRPTTRSYTQIWKVKGH